MSMTSIRGFLYCFLLIVLCAAVFAQVRTFDFIIHDDPIYIYQNPHIRYGISSEGLRWAFSADLLKDSPEADYWRPLTFISHMIDAELFGMNPQGHHIMNLLFHILNVVMLFLFLRQITERPSESLLVAALFAIHPLQVQSVAWVTARKDLLSACFGLLTLWTYASWAKNPERSDLKISSVILFILGLMTKPLLIVIPAVMLALDYWPLKVNKNVWLLIREKIPYGIFSAAVLAVMFFGKSAVSIDVPAHLRILNIIFNLQEYWIHFLWPVHLSIYTAINHSTVSPVHAVSIIAVLIIILFFIWFRRKQSPWMLVGLLWFLIFIAPSISLTRADRFMYLPVIGLSLVLVFTGSYWLETFRINQFVRVVASCLIIAFLIPISYHNTSLWRNGEVLFSSVIQKNPDHHRAHFILAQVLTDKGMRHEAIAHFKRALNDTPKDSGIYNEIGLNYMKLNKTKDAIRNFILAGRAYPKPAILSINYNNIGLTYQQKEQWGIARSYFHKSIRANPEYPQPYYNLAQIAFVFGKDALAMNYLKKAILANPYYEEARNELGSLLAKYGKPTEAAEQFRAILRINSRSLRALNNLGGILLQTGQVGEAKQYFERALKLEPDYEPAKKNLEIINQALQTYRNQLSQK